MANERTALAWIRTALAMVAAGIVRLCAVAAIPVLLAVAGALTMAT
jgi:uncharacterized membrane protein YidH (DUF202 family)